MNEYACTADISYNQYMHVAYTNYAFEYCFKRADDAHAEFETTITFES